MTKSLVMLAKSTNALANLTPPQHITTIQLQHNIELLVFVHKTLAIFLYVVSAMHLSRALSSYTHFPRFPRAQGVWLRRLLLCVSIFNAVAMWIMLVTIADRWLQSPDSFAEVAISKLDRLQRRLARANAIDGRVLMLWMYVLGFAMATVAIQFRWQTQLHSTVQYVRYFRFIFEIPIAYSPFENKTNRRFSFAHGEATEIGRCVHFLLQPPSNAVQRLYDVCDRLYASRRHRQQLQPLETNDSTQNIAALRRRIRDKRLSRSDKNRMSSASITGSHGTANRMALLLTALPSAEALNRSVDVATGDMNVAANANGVLGLNRPNVNDGYTLNDVQLTVRRCMSFESM